MLWLVWLALSHWQNPNVDYNASIKYDSEIDWNCHVEVIIGTIAYGHVIIHVWREGEIYEKKNGAWTNLDCPSPSVYFLSFLGKCLKRRTSKVLETVHLWLNSDFLIKWRQYNILMYSQSWSFTWALVVTCVYFKTRSQFKVHVESNVLHLIGIKTNWWWLLEHTILFPRIFKTYKLKVFAFCCIFR